MLKSTMQDLADAVGVSRITVWKALNDREGVSPRTKKRIQQKAAEMGLTDTEIQMEKIPEKETGRDEAEERTFSVVVSRPESSAFWMQIIHHLYAFLLFRGLHPARVGEERGWADRIEYL